MNNTKFFNRFYHIGLNGLRSVLSPILSFALSYIVIHNYSKHLWGEFVKYLLYFFVASMILNWGGKEFLLRQFSLKPSKIVPTWQHFFVARIPIFFLVVLTVPIWFSSQAYAFMALWIASGFVINAFMPVYLYKRDYLKVILVESISFILLAFLLYRQGHDHIINVYEFGWYYAWYLLVKMTLYILIYHPFLKFKKIKFSLQILVISLPFLWLSLTGFFQSKVDLYVFAFFHKSALLADYQIISGFLVFSQSIATILLLPYVKNVYRMKNSSLKRLSRLTGIAGIILNAFVLLTILTALQYFYDIQLNFWQILWSYLIGLPSYFYVVTIFYLFKEKKEKKVVLVAILSLLINLTLSIILLYLELEITGVLIANATAQITSLVLYWQYRLND